MPAAKRRPSLPCNAMPAHRWSRTRALKDVFQLNEYLLDVLSVLAALGTPTSLEVVTRHADLWRQLDLSARRKAAQIPVLLLDLNFQNEAWWQGVIRTSKALLTDQRVQAHRADCWLPEFTRETLMIVWPTVREDRVVASLLFGMSDSVAELIGSLTPQQLDHVSLHYSHEMRLRWAQSHAFWRGLLVSAQSEDPDALNDLHLFGIQLLAGERLRGHCLSTARRRG
ncbi:MAG: flagellar transcriptional regulator FlhD [Chloroflexota bacterium]|nr:flagellar transcriptional regulator FlhD [Chloroflexota bacterium]